MIQASYSFFSQLISRFQMFQYAMVGAVAALVDFGLFVFLTYALSFNYILAATFSFIIATYVNYLLCIRFVFASQNKFTAKTEVMLTYFVSAIGMICHHSCLIFLVEFFSLTLIMAKILAMGSAFFWNYLSRKYWIFGHYRPIP